MGAGRLVIGFGANLIGRLALDMGVSAAAHARILCGLTTVGRLTQPYFAYQQVDYMAANVDQAREAIARGDMEGAAALLGRSAGLAPSAFTSLRETARFGRALASFNPTTINSYLAACFAAGTPILGEHGAKPIEDFRPGDRLWARDEFDPNGPLELKEVEEVFQTEAPIWHVHLRGPLSPSSTTGGQHVIRTTAEHPFFVKDKGWTATKDLQVGDVLLGHDGQESVVEDLLDAGQSDTVYNFRVADYHTYYVGSPDWGFSVWAHNACIVGSYNQLRGRGPTGTQAHHLNQQAAFGSVIPHGRGVCIYLQGGTNVVGSEHYRFHQSLKQFWRKYQRGGELFGTKPTNLQYDAALRAALKAAGKSAAEIRQIARAARQQRLDYELDDDIPVPDVPRLN
jgi:hypothetical protein